MKHNTPLAMTVFSTGTVYELLGNDVRSAVRGSEGPLWSVCRSRCALQHCASMLCPTFGVNMLLHSQLWGMLSHLLQSVLVSAVLQERVVAELDVGLEFGGGKTLLAASKPEWYCTTQFCKSGTKANLTMYAS